MRILFVILWIVFTIPAARSAEDVPELFTKEQFNAATLAQAANHYISLGEEKALKALKSLEEDYAASIDQGFDKNERIGWVCRILFIGKDGEPLRPPMYGGLSLPRLTMPMEKWPLYPVAESEGVFFVLSEGYMLGGLPEQASSYIDYCSTTGEFRKQEIAVPSRDEAIKAFNSLKTANRWTMIKWKDEGPGTKYTMNEDWTLQEIETQATSIPEKQAK